MHKYLFILLPAMIFIASCQQNTTDSQANLAKLQKEVLQKQDLLLRIHLELDSAASEIAKSEQMAEGENCSGAGFHASEAYRKLVKADEAILDLGRDLQTLFNLDTEKSNL